MQWGHKILSNQSVIPDIGVVQSVFEVYGLTWHAASPSLPIPTTLLSKPPRPDGEGNRGISRPARDRRPCICCRKIIAEL